MGERKLLHAMELAGEGVPDSCHVCLVFDDDEQRRRIVTEYLAEGLRRGEQIRYFTDQSSPESVRSWLAQVGLEAKESGADAPFRIMESTMAYCPNGSFDPRAMIGGMLPRFEAARKSGFRGSRSTGEMSWALRGIPGSNRLLEYEALLNTVGGDFPHSGMCQYDARLFDGATLFKILQLHPYMIAQGQIIRNPYYVKPEAKSPHGEARG